MQKLKKPIIGLAVASLSLIVLSGCTNQEKNQNQQNNQESTGQNTEEYVIDQSDFVKGDELVKDVPVSQVNQEEIAGLILMREEEKLARDVYTTLGEKWGINIFTNIAKSEQTHTDAVKVLLDRYDITDPVKDDTIGVFTSEVLDKLYNDLVAQGNTSLVEALTVGAIIEDLDIKDLNELTKKTNKEDIIVTYNNLNKGSRNHLRAFISQLEKNNGSYSPQYITQSEYDEIISSSQERGRAK